MKCADGGRRSLPRCGAGGEINAALRQAGAENFSVWSIQDFLFCQVSIPTGLPAGGLPRGKVGGGDGGLRDIRRAGNASADVSRHRRGAKGQVAHPPSRVRHEAEGRLRGGIQAPSRCVMVEAQGDKVSPGPGQPPSGTPTATSSAMQLVKSFDSRDDRGGAASTVAWETRQLEIMDWLTDDVDWITGQKHDAMERVVGQ